MASDHPLPLIWLLSDARNDAHLEQSLECLPPGSGFVFRHYHLQKDVRVRRFAALCGIARRNGHVVVLAGNEDWPADGTYGGRRRRETGLHLATAHDGPELQAAVRDRADGVFLSPVFRTASHPGGVTLGLQGFHTLAQQSPIPVIALGGMDAARARLLGWPRWGAIDGLTSDSPPPHTAGPTD
ncbi:thiamine phosphate synthase [Erythrobacter litoralis]|uniref:thiamine phosphate synthase n=1 Tax=Erythrobacter litoralis TaxID=39960 RepID=UPI00243550BB|nr:thiamine phosphate synthase [Erythrobacter litoralis]MDG6080111.1 thiamine phosphate synthase [Erythrobacter litoralis]